MNGTNAHKIILPAALAILPSGMRGQRAEAMLIAIGLQESDFRHRRQIRGPARGYWMFEQIGVAGVLQHRASRTHAHHVCTELGYTPDAIEIHAAMQHNDILACAFARLLLWSIPEPLPGRTDEDEAYRQYLSAWRPGRQTPSRWPHGFKTAWAITDREG